MSSSYIAPSINLTAFNCPYCHAYAQQIWYTPSAIKLHRNGNAPSEKIQGNAKNPSLKEDEWAKVHGRPMLNCMLSQCNHCKDTSIWVGNDLVFPVKNSAPVSNPDTPQDILIDYNEAASILNISPRGAAALMRLAIQKLCKHLGKPGKDIHSDIGSLVKDGLSPKVQQALDIVRVVGNNAVHPGKLDIRDNRDIALMLFTLFNLIVDKTITEPRAIDNLYSQLPESALQAIAKRDKPAS